MVTPDSVKGLRETNNWSQSELARYCRCNQSTIARIENGGQVTGPISVVLESLLSKSIGARFQQPEPSQ